MRSPILSPLRPATATSVTAGSWYTTKPYLRGQPTTRTRPVCARTRLTHGPRATPPRAPPMASTSLRAAPCARCVSTAPLGWALAPRSPAHSPLALARLLVLDELKVPDGAERAQQLLALRRGAHGHAHTHTHRGAPHSARGERETRTLPHRCLLSAPRMDAIIAEVATWGSPQNSPKATAPCAAHLVLGEVVGQAADEDAVLVVAVVADDGGGGRRRQRHAAVQVRARCAAAAAAARQDSKRQRLPQAARQRRTHRSAAPTRSTCSVCSCTTAARWQDASARALLSGT